MTTLEHMALKTRKLEQTTVSCMKLGAEILRHAAGQRLFAEFDAGTRLIFDVTDLPIETQTVTYLESDEAVDSLFKGLSRRVQIVRDVREQYRHDTGPYGFFVNDPDGHVLKIFKYRDYGGTTYDRHHRTTLPESSSEESTHPLY